MRYFSNMPKLDTFIILRCPHLSIGLYKAVSDTPNMPSKILSSNSLHEEVNHAAYQTLQNFSLLPIRTMASTFCFPFSFYDTMDIGHAAEWCFWE